MADVVCLMNPTMSARGDAAVFSQGLVSERTGLVNPTMSARAVAGGAAGRAGARGV